MKLQSHLMIVVAVISFFVAGVVFEAKLHILSEITDQEKTFAHTDESLVTRLSQGDPGLAQGAKAEETDPAADCAVTKPDQKSVFVEWQQELRSKLLNTLFDIPKIAAPQQTQYIEIRETKVEEKLRRTFILVTSYDGTQIPVYLFRHDDTRKRPGILVLPGHVAPHQSGIEQTIGTEDSYQHGSALRLAQAGYAVITIELRGFGYIGPNVGYEHRFVAYNAILEGGFYKKALIQDIKRAVDLLCSLGQVDSDRIGVTGVSFGGEMAVTYAALDARIKTVVCQGFGGRLGPMQAAKGTAPEKLPHYCHLIPGINRLMQWEDWFHLVTPRPVLVVRGDKEKHTKTLPEFAEVVQGKYRLFDRSSEFEYLVEQGEHEYFVEPAIRFFKQHL